MKGKTVVKRSLFHSSKITGMEGLISLSLTCQQCHVVKCTSFHFNTIGYVRVLNVYTCTGKKYIQKYTPLSR